jgi:hypothetical protein
MLSRLQDLLRRKFILSQLVVLLVWFVIELAGYGTGLLAYIARHPLTNTDGFHINDLWLGSAPPGPVRLSRAERAAVAARIGNAFGGNPPKHTTLAELRWMYALKPGSLCVWRGGNVASDPAECNRIERAHVVFTTLLKVMHPKTEVLMLEEARSNKGDVALFAFFVGIRGKPQILVDLSRVRPDVWDKSQGFLLKAYHGNGLTEIPLGTDVNGQQMFIVDDPGAFDRRTPSCSASNCMAQLLLYGFGTDASVDSLGKRTSRNLTEIALSEALEQRFKLFAAVMNQQQAPTPKATYDKTFKPRKFGVTVFDTALLKRKLDEALGAGASERAVFSPFGFHVAFGSVYGILLDGRLYTIWDGGAPHASLGTDKFVFHIRAARKLTEITGVRSSRGVHIIPFPVGATTGQVTLTVHKFIEQQGEPWSEFSDFEAVFTRLIAERAPIR